MFESSSIGADKLSATETELWLLGQPPLHHYLDYVEENALKDAPLNRSDLIAKWAAANDKYAELEATERNLADGIEVSTCPSFLTAKISDLKNSSRFGKTFNSVPTRFAMVELDRLIVSQPHINLDHATRLKAELPQNPSEDEVFDFGFPAGGRPAPVQARKLTSQRYLFWSPSSDFRFLEAALCPPDETIAQKTLGTIGGMLGIAVGFGPNFLSAIQCENRLVLDNGHHRAYALRDLGLTHAPCIVETVRRGDELGLVAPGAVVDNPEFYFKAPRPPVLKDFFDPEISGPVRIRRTLQMIEVSLEVKSFEVSD